MKKAETFASAFVLWRSLRRWRCCLLLLLALLAADGQRTFAAEPATGKSTLFDVAAMGVTVSLVNVLYPRSDAAPSAEGVVADQDRDLKARVKAAGGTYDVATRAWYFAGSATSSSALARAEAMFGLDTQAAVFGSAPVADMQSWLGNVASLIPSGGPLRYVIGTKIAFSDAWINGFERSATVNRAFFGRRATVSRPFLTRTDGYRYARRSDGMHAGVPLRGRMTLWLYQPSAGIAIDDFATLRKAYDAGLAATAYRPCLLSFPRFALDQRPRSILNALLGGAFPGIPQFHTSRFPTDVLQNATIAVDEDGVTTSSTTVAYEYLRAIRTETALIFSRPFVFAIVDDTTRRVIFTGSVADLP
jgi:hypothetical protein